MNSKVGCCLLETSSVSRHSLTSLEETLSFGKDFAAKLSPGAVLALSGPLGAGKTSFVQGLALGLKINEPILSPTFVLLNLYQNLAHFDLYRLKTSSEFLSLGFDEYLSSPYISVIEWPDRISSLLPRSTIYIEFTHTPEGRSATIR